MNQFNVLANTLLNIVLITIFSIMTSVSSANSLFDIRSLLYPKNPKIRTDVFILEKDSKIIIEDYKRGYTKNNKHLSWSIAKTVAALLIGRAQTLGYLHISDKIKKYIPLFQTDATILDALQMSSGVQFHERYSGIPVNEDITKFLYLEGPETGFEKFILTRPIVSKKPGEYFYYSSGDTNLLMLVLKKALPVGVDYNNWPWLELFNKLDMEITLEQSSDGVFIGSSYLYARPKAFLKFAKLIINSGYYQGQQIISPDFIELYYKLALGVEQENLGNEIPHRAYSIQTTTNLPIMSRADQSEYPSLPLDTLFMIGYQGQFIAFSRSAKMIILRLSMDQGRAFPRHKLFPLIYRYLKSQTMSYLSSNDSLGLEKKYLKQEKKTIWDFANLHLAPKLLQRYAAKELCSCHFILGRSIEQCSKDLGTGVPYIPSFRIDLAKKEVFTGIIPGLFESKAKFRSTKLGCYLPPSE